MNKRRHVFYFSPDVIDLNKLREDAQFYACDGGWSRGEPVGTTIHYHDKEEPCRMYKHEEFEVE